MASTIALVGAPSVAATGAGSPLPNLAIGKASVGLSHGRIAGSFTVSDTGRSRAGGSQAQLSLVVGKTLRKLKVFRVPPLASKHSYAIKVSFATPSGLPTGTHSLVVCADTSKAVRESSERDNCKVVGRLVIAAPGATNPGATNPGATNPGRPAPTSPGPTAGSAPSPAPAPASPTSTSPADTPTEPQPGPAQQPTSPMTVASDTPTLVTDSYDGMTGSYYVDTPPSYDTSGATPMRLLVWMHGCGGNARGDSYETTASNTLDSSGDTQPDDDRDFISISIGGADGGCWNVDTDVEKVLVAIADVATHFNIDRRHIFIAGYSSGGDLAYRTIFYNADEFAGILTVNTHPFRDTGSTEAQSLAAAAWTFNIAHVAHAQDEEYHVNPCSQCLDNGDGTYSDDPGVTPAMNDLTNAGYTVKYFIEQGTHSDQDDFNAGTGTDYDWRQYVRPFVDQSGWQSPG